MAGRGWLWGGEPLRPIGPVEYEIVASNYYGIWRREGTLRASPKLLEKATREARLMIMKHKCRLAVRLSVRNGTEADIEVLP